MSSIYFNGRDSSARMFLKMAHMVSSKSSDPVALGDSLFLMLFLWLLLLKTPKCICMSIYSSILDNLLSLKFLNILFFELKLILYGLNSVSKMLKICLQSFNVRATVIPVRLQVKVLLRRDEFNAFPSARRFLCLLSGKRICHCFHDQVAKWETSLGCGCITS